MLDTAAVEELATGAEDDAGAAEDVCAKDDEEGVADEVDGAVLLLVTGVELGFTLLDPPPPPPQAVINPVNAMPINSLDRGKLGWLINRSLLII